MTSQLLQADGTPVNPQAEVPETPAIMLPWSEWKDSDVIQTEIHAISTAMDETGKLTLNVKDGEGKTEEFGELTQPAIVELSKRIGFPTEFIQKLSPELQPTVINDRIKAARKQKFSFVTDEDSRIIAASPGWRESTSHREIAQISYDALMGMDEVESVEVDMLQRKDGTLNLRFMTPIQTAITPAVGDILQMGLNITHSFGTELSVSLFTKRLVCLNGMVSTNRPYGWTSDAAKTKGRQIEWLREAVTKAIEEYDLLIARASEMSRTLIQGDMSAALYQRARNLRIPQRFIPHILEAFNKEPGNTEWHMLNAITRFASHNADAQLRNRLQLDAGTWVENFKMATARLPLYMAQQGGYQIISTENENETVTTD